ncbi:alpha-1,6-glucosidase domain-containing protein [Salinimonas lutimaris]|uniref:alpha-1,6-glucosidase domain-containing protein n=1 Tax=Salinimonas lutimaris TaxID=914153 RepID=UPI001585DA8B|nr:alpha-1,6-glucosidase domain-containing protein [Salinimonas lutimaris]
MMTWNRVGSLLLILCALTLTGCGGSDVESGSNDLLTCDVPNVPNAAGTACEPPPPIECEAPLVPNEANDECVNGADPSLADPVFFPAENQAVLYYNRADVDADNSPSDPAYEGWRLHTWNNEECDAYADADTDWANGRVHDGIDPNYGAYWILDLKPDYGSCHNFIIHIGTDADGKELGGGDFKGSLIQDDERFTRMNFTLSGEARIFEYPLLSLGEQPVAIEGRAAHWLDATTLLWNAPEEVSYVKLHYSASAGLKATLEEGLNGDTLELMSATLSQEQSDRAPHLASLAAWQGNWEDAEAKTVLTTQVVLAGYNAEDKLVAATGIQPPLVLDALYTQGENDADEAQLGALYTDSGISAALWAPTAQAVSLLIYNEDKTLNRRETMSRDDNTGVWRFDGDTALDRALYRYEVVVYHPNTEVIETLLLTDPYSHSVSTNGRFSRFINLADEDLKPDGWDSHTIPVVNNPEDAVIYEGHIREFSALDESVSEQNRGKYLAFTEANSNPVRHLQTLVEAGLNYFHVMPAADIATIEEDTSKTVNLYDTVGKLCQLNRDAQVCTQESPDAVLLDVFNSYDPLQEAVKAQALVQDMRRVDQFNWGYDPHHYTTPEGSYASDPEGIARIKEMRAMIQALHEMGLRVALDVVYNHTASSGVFANSVLDKAVPGYYHRYEVDTGVIVQETCCEDTEPRNVMMEKLIHDSLLTWTEHYKYDSFRFDIMSQGSKDMMLRLREAVQAIDEDNYFYGEGWPRIDRGFEMAVQQNMSGTQIGTFNDRIREAVRQGNIFNPESDALLSDQDKLKMGMAGTLKDFILETSTGSAGATSNLGGYAEDPADIINYVSKHDNETLWDQLNYTLPADITLAERVRAQNVAGGVMLMSQGIPFLQLGGDFLRSKSMDRNTYDAGDWFTYVDFTFNTNNWNVGLPLAEDNEARWEEMGRFIYDADRQVSMTDIEYASQIFNELLRIRTQSPLFRLTTAQDIIDRVGFHNIGARQQKGLIAMSLDDGLGTDEQPRTDLDPNADALMVLVNTGYEEASMTVNTATGFMLHSEHMNSVDAAISSATFTEGDDGNGTFTVPALSIVVFVKPQSGSQGTGLSAYATSGAPDVVPFGDTTLYVRGSFNNWEPANPMAYRGDGIYSTVVTLEQGVTYEFKLADANWESINLGGGDVSVVTEDEPLLLNGGDNLVFTPASQTTWRFILDASDVSAPVLTVENDDIYAGTEVFLRGDMTDWGTSAPFTYRNGRVYRVAMDLAPGTYGFKVASEDWSTVNFGALSSADSDTQLVPGSVLPVAATNDNLSVTITENGRYVFAFDVSDLANPQVGVFKEDFFGQTEVFLRGAMNGWSAEDQFTYQGEGLYTLQVELSEGATEFKVASEDWATVNLGNPNEAATNKVLPGLPKTLGSSNNNLLIDVPAGLYEFSVQGPNWTAPTLTVTAL